jgi:hypothetical protein
MTARGPVLDRPLEPAWLDVALRIARETHELDEVRSRLHLALGDSGLGTAARVKTVTALVRTWARPRQTAAPAISWAREALADEQDLRAVHLGALLVAYPFFGDVCATVGRVLALEEQVTTPDIRARMRAAWGDRRTVHNAVQRGIKTLRAFQVLSGDQGSSLSQRAEQLYVSPRAGRWMAHTLLLSRGAEAIDERDLRSAPELFGLRLPERLDNGYGFLARHREGGGRTVLAVV